MPRNTVRLFSNNSQQVFFINNQHFKKPDETQWIWMDNQTNQVSYNHFYKHNQLFQKFHEIQWGPGNSRASL